MADASCDAVNTSPCIIYRPKKSRKSKRVLAARIFLKNISFDGKQSETYANNHGSSLLAQFGVGGCSKSKSLQQITSEEDRLISSISTADKVPLHHCVSVACAGNIEDDLKRQLNSQPPKHIFNPTDVKYSKSKSFIASSLEVPQERRTLKESSKVNLIEPRHFLRKPIRNFVDKRTVLVSRNALPFRIMSIMPYRKETSMMKERRMTSVPQINNSIAIDGVEKAEGEKVLSYSHLLVPATFSKKRNSEYNETTEETTTNLIREVPEATNDASYDPLLLDDPELTSGKHRTVLNLTSYRVSIIQYAKPSEIKKDINERFKEMFPNMHITLTKLRSIKTDMLEIGTKCGLEKATIACSHVYFEKLVIKEKINKANRKYCAGACLILAAKFMEDIKKGSVSLIIEAVVDKFRLHLRDLLSSEILVLIALEFSLCLPGEEVNPLYRRIEGGHFVNTNSGHISSS